MFEEIPFVLKFLFVGFIFFVPFFYLLWSLVARRFLSVNWYDLSLYMSCSFFVASWGEPLANVVYKYFAGEYLWTYQLLPILGGASTVIGFLTWPFYGYHWYFLHQALALRGLEFSTWKGAGIAAIDGIPFDMLGNGFALLLFGFIFFYYPTPEFWHLSAWWVIPIYVVYGLICAVLLKYLFSLKKSFLVPSSFYVLGIMVMVAGELFI